MLPIINTPQFESLVCGDVQSFAMILDDFDANGTQLIQTISRQPADSTSAPKDALHQLKGSSGMLGLSSLFEMSKEYETKEPLDLSEKEISSLRSLFQQSIDAAREALAKIDNAT